MLSGVITKNPNLCIDSRPHHHLPFPKSPNFLGFCSNTHHSKPPLQLENCTLSFRSCKFRTKAIVNDEVVVSATEANMSFYELLGISESGSFSDIKQAYKQLARKYHPDVSPPDRAEEYTKRFILVQEAYETLSDPSTRALYDRDMAKGLHLAFSVRKGFDEGLMGKNEWRNQWQDQVAGLKEKRMRKNNMSWAAQMRRQKV